jgi:copper(I)-binding protein
VRSKLPVAVVVTLALLAGCVVNAAAATKESIVIKGATVTSAKKGRPCAISFTLTNEAGSTIWITEVSSPFSNTYMMDKDANMTLKSSRMLAVASIKVKVGHSVTFSLHGQGAMLGSILKTFKAGTTVPLEVGWHSKSRPLTTLLPFTARVVKAPTKLYFGESSNGSMPGMDMG